MNLPTQGAVSDCFGKHAIGLCNWNLDIISPCFDFIEDIFRLCETSNKDDLLWAEIKVRASKWKTNTIPTSTDQSTAVAVSVTPSSIFWMRGLKKLNISFLKAFMRIVRQPLNQVRIAVFLLGYFQTPALDCACFVRIA